MIQSAYSIFDIKSRAYGLPFFAVNDATAKRIVSDAAQDMNTSLGRHPADFILYRIGTFDNEAPRIIGFDAKEHIADVISLLPASAQMDIFKKETV